MTLQQVFRLVCICSSNKNKKNVFGFSYETFVSVVWARRELMVSMVSFKTKLANALIINIKPASNAQISF